MFRAIPLVLFLMPAGFAAIAEETIWAEVSGWTIKVGDDGDRGCFATRQMEDGSEIQIGVAAALDKGFFAIYNPKWTEIVEGEKGFVEFDFGVSRFGGETVAEFQNGVPGGYVLFDNPAFVEEFSQRYSVEIIGKKRGITFDMDLTGTRKAVAEVLACQSGADNNAAAN